MTYPNTRLILIVGSSSDKDIVGIVRELAPLASDFIATRSQHPRSAEIETIAAEARRYRTKVHTAPDLLSALSLARELAGPDDVICATGSLFVVAEAREAVGLKTAKARFVPQLSTDH
jgi:dihydrofolate synthase/folylpolyglutamate synthase